MTPDARAPLSPRVVESIDPTTGRVLRRFAAAGAADVQAAVTLARQMQPEWAARPLSERLRMLDRLHEAIMRRRSEVVEQISLETGKPTPEVMAAEVLVALDLISYYRRESGRLLEPERFTPSSLSMWRKRVLLQREPYGVIGIISPWNYPFMLPMGLIVPALVSGNAVLLKPSEFTPSSAGLIASLLADAGLPSGLFALLQGDGETGQLLTTSPVDKVFFTGSVATGRRVALACAERLVPCVLELGGSDAAIVLDDANIEHAASGILWARFTNAGQTCVAPKRVFVEAGVYDAFVAALSRRVTALRVSGRRDGSADVGPLVRLTQRTLIAAQCDDAVTRGGSVAARASVDDDMQRQSDSVDGLFFAPTILTDVPDDARALTEETFGPVLPVIRVSDQQEAIARANAGSFGLSASVWSRNHGRALAVAARLQSGTVMINDAASIAGMADVPHGGVKGSGTGRTHGAHGLEECTRIKATVDDRFTGWRQPWWFGYTPETMGDLDGFARVAHGRTIRERLRGLWPMLRLVFAPRRPL